MLKKIDVNFSNQTPGIQSVTLVGAAGAGKTTLARLYSRSQEYAVVWEINAESRESLRRSFLGLAYSLSLTPRQRSELDRIQKNTNSQAQEDQLLCYLKKRLREVSSWLLIYDNVEALSEVKEFLPEDEKLWGSGKIIITTRDINSSANSYINPKSVILIDELTQTDVLALFSQILYDCPPEQLISPLREKVRLFLRKIDWLPLDVSISAYYIKNTKITFRKYLERIQQFNKQFDQVQESLLKNVNHYAKTCYGIVESFNLRYLC